MEPHSLTELNNDDMRIILLMEEATPRETEEDKLKSDDISDISCGISIAIEAVERHEIQINDIKAQLREIYLSIEFS
jgi:hypothetical protein